MENELMNVGQNNIMENFVKTDDILKDMCGIIESSQKAAYQAVNTAANQRHCICSKAERYRANIPARKHVVIKSKRLM